MIIDIPTVEGGEFIDGGPNTLGTIVTAAFLNSLMKSSTATTKEIQTILKNAGIAPDSRVHDQLFKAISKMITDNKVGLTDVLGTSKTLAASQFLVNEVSKNIDLVSIQVTKNTKEIDGKMSVGAFGLGASTPPVIDINTLSNVRTGFIANFAELPSMPTGSKVGIALKRGLDITHLLYATIANELYMTTKWGERPEDTVRFLHTGDLTSLMYIPVDQIFYFDSAIPPFGFIARNGQNIDEVKMPKLFAKYGSKMPDDRNRNHRMAGNLTSEVGTTQEDAIQNIKGDVLGRASNNTQFNTITNLFSTASGAFSLDKPSSSGTLETLQQTPGISTADRSSFQFDASRTVRTATETRVKSRIVIACNKIQ